MLTFLVTVLPMGSSTSMPIISSYDIGIIGANKVATYPEQLKHPTTYVFTFVLTVPVIGSRLKAYDIEVGGMPRP